MKHTIPILLSGAFLLLSGSFLQAKEKNSGDNVQLTYSLPSTVITLEVEAVQEVFHAGPYARYAEKYLGVKARQKDEATVRLKSIKMTPYVEADPSRRYALQVEKGDIDGSVFRLSQSGLVTLSDASFGEGVAWRFPERFKSDFSGRGVSSNLTSESTTLYRNSKRESSGKVAVQQNMVVEKSAEKKASEAAQTIFTLRQKRLEIVTGDTDATYSGQAMGSAIEELSRLEDEYMSMFVGYSDYSDMAMSFDVIPDADPENRMYIAFRVSDAAGLLPADNIAGKPVVMEIVPQEKSEPVVSVEVDKAGKSNKKALKNPVYYRVPAICTVKITDGMNLLLQSRIPVYQLGEVQVMPANVVLK